MTTANPIDPTHGVHDDEHAHAHPAHLAHHFDTPEQQFSTGKMGMWVFLGTEILMFGGLFCAYAVYRHNHPDVFSYAHLYLDKFWGAFNTVVLLISSFTMAWAVRASQIGQRWLTVALCMLTILGGFGFMCVKFVEYKAKWEHHLFPGKINLFNTLNQDELKKDLPHLEHEMMKEHNAPHGQAKDSTLEEGATHEVTADASTPHGGSAGNDSAYHGTGSGGAPMGDRATRVAATSQSADTQPTGGAPESMHVARGTIPAPQPQGTVIPSTLDEKKTLAAATQASPTTAPTFYFDPHSVEAGKTDAAKIVPSFVTPPGLSPVVAHTAHKALGYDDLHDRDRTRVNTFFGIYFVMTGLHGVHVLVGMALIFWVGCRAAPPKFKYLLPPLAPLAVAVGFFAMHASIGQPLVLGLAIGSAVFGLIWLVIAFGLSLRVPAGGVGEFSPEYYTPVDLVGLYWHLVDLIWIFLFPLLYLIH